MTRPETGFKDPPKRITVDDGNPAGPLVYDLGSLNVALARERDEWQRIALQKREELTTAHIAGTTAARRCMDAEAALQRIADMPTTPRADGTYNYDRNALVQIARIALGRSDA